MPHIRNFLIFSGGTISLETASGYLGTKSDGNPETYNTALKCLRRLAAFAGCKDILESFKFAPVEILPKEPPTDAQVRAGYEAQPDDLSRSIYLVYATAGPRRGEGLGLKRDQIDPETRSVKPGHFTRTKRSGLTFINPETAACLARYLGGRTDGDPRVFPITEDSRQFRNVWNRASESAGVRITPKVLRLWQSCKLGENGVGDRYVDIFQGRAPRKVIAKAYTGRGAEQLKRIYDNAAIAVGA